MPSEVLEQRVSLLSVIHEKAMKVSKRADELMVSRHATKNPPCVYSVGEEVLVKMKSKKWNKVKGKGLSVPPSSVGRVLETRPTTNQYKVVLRVDGQDKVEWISVSQISSLTRAEDKQRERTGTVQGISILDRSGILNHLAFYYMHPVLRNSSKPGKSTSPESVIHKKANKAGTFY